MRIKKAIFIVLGCISTALGGIGAVLPLLPTFPFLLLAAYCFARSSDRLHHWFTGTKLYQENLESYLQGKGMTIKAKLRIMVTVSLFMLVGFLLMDAVPIGRTILAVVWILHVIYFVFGVKTCSGNQD